MHVPVLVKEVVEGLRCSPKKIIVDCTVGEGGHSEAILRAAAPDGRVIGIEQDEGALRLAAERLRGAVGSLALIHGNFVDIKEILHKEGIDKVDGILFDLGVCSHQLLDPERGFSFLHDGPLDMRMDRRIRQTAALLVNRLSEKELADLIRTYGEERWAKRIARAIARSRVSKPLTRTGQLTGVITDALPRPRGHRAGRLHPATRTFQALRIAINRELDCLEQALPKAAELLRPGGRLCVISFHSLEDRIVKQTFRRLSAEREKGLLRIVTKRPITPDLEEVSNNPRSRSAKLRIAEMAQG